MKSDAVGEVMKRPVPKYVERAVLLLADEKRGHIIANILGETMTWSTYRAAVALLNAYHNKQSRHNVTMQKIERDRGGSDAR